MMASDGVALLFLLVSIGLFTGGLLQRLKIGDLEKQLAEHDRTGWYPTEVATKQFQQQMLVSNIIQRLTMIEKLVYLSPGDSVSKEYLLKIMIALGNDLARKEVVGANTEGSPVYRYRNYGLELTAEQALVDWARGLEERSNKQSTGNPVVGG